jgi:short-subunit dehydrogenase
MSGPVWRKPSAPEAGFGGAGTGPKVRRGLGRGRIVNLRGGRVLLTGAGGGIGAAVAEAVAAAGATLVLTGRQSERLDPVAERTGGRVVLCDLAEAGAVAELVGAVGVVDVLIANAGVPASGSLLERDLSSIETALAVNLRAPIQLARALAPAMVARGRGHLVFVSSLSGLATSPRSSLYSATKFGLRGFALGLRQDLAEAGVGVSVVLPGFVRDAGMFARSGATLPPWVGTRSPADVGRAVVGAVERNRAEVVVAPAHLALGAYLGGAFPALSARVQRALGGDRIAERVAAGQRHLG